MSAGDLGSTTKERVELLAAERPDLIPLLRECARRERDADGKWWNDDDDDPVTRDGLRELVRRGLLSGVESS